MKSSFVIVSNRLPITYERDDDGVETVRAGSGGLVTALIPIIKKTQATWIGWPGTERVDDKVRSDLALLSTQGLHLEPVELSPRLVENFYQGFSNEVIWPLFHDLQYLCNFRPEYWRAYREANTLYAETILKNIGEGSLIWVHDYHLMHVAHDLRMTHKPNTVAFFLHIPFPSPDIFFKLPWREETLMALLEYDLVGFQTRRDKHNFFACLQHYQADFNIQIDIEKDAIKRNHRTTHVGDFPISIDFFGFEKRAKEPAISNQVAELKRILPGRKLILGIDRLDYTKGIPHRLRAFRNALLRYPSLHEHVTLIQAVIPSRAVIPQYAQLKSEIEQLVSEINGEFTHPGGWVPIHYVFRHLTNNDLLTYYRAADIALVTPLKDGMNLVAKEYCACNYEEDAILILSEFAGAAQELSESAMLVNPYDVEVVADTIATALSMPLNERNNRMRHLRKIIRDNDIFAWTNRFLSAVEKATTSKSTLNAELSAE